MSHTVTITRTTTTSGTTSALIINTGYIKTIPGLLKLFQLLLGAACTGVMLWYLDRYIIRGSPELFFLTMAVTFMISTFCLLASCLVSLSTGGIISKTIYLLGAACTGIMLYYLNHYVVRESPELFFLLMAVTFMIGTFCLLMSCLVSLSTGGIISKTIYELIYHTIACILILACSLNLIIRIDNYKRTERYEPFLAASIIGLILGVICTGIIAYYSSRNYILRATPELFYLLMVVTFMIATFCLLVSCLVSLSTGGIISKTIYELVYHTIACILLLAASLTLLIEINNYKHTALYDPYMAASIIGLVNAVLYCISAIYAQRSYRGI